MKQQGSSEQYMAMQGGNGGVGQQGGKGVKEGFLEEVRKD